MSYVDGSPSLVSDTPCAFTEAYHHLMTATDGPEIGVSITSPLSVPYHIKTEVPSGINTLQGANRDPGLPVVDKDKHNLTPSGALSIGKAYELKFMHDEVQSCFPSSFVFLQAVLQCLILATILLSHVKYMLCRIFCLPVFKWQNFYPSVYVHILHDFWRHVRGD
jgi:hypothetical protein